MMGEVSNIHERSDKLELESVWYKERSYALRIIPQQNTFNTWKTTALGYQKHGLLFLDPWRKQVDEGIKVGSVFQVIGNIAHSESNSVQ